MMKTAKLEPYVVDVICPYCNEQAENEEGSLMWTVNDLEPGETFGCNHCGEVFKIPSRVQSVRLEKAD